MTLPDAYGDEPEVPAAEPTQPEVSPRSRGVALGLCLVGGIFGLHRFYVGKTKTAILMLLTGGGCFVWWLYDLVLAATGEFRDADDLPLRRWAVESFEQPRSFTGRAEQRLGEMEAQIDSLRQQFSDLAERVDFAERMLAQKREPQRLPPSSSSSRAP
jgi:TM2 domain-containing membrane protein YozV